MNLKQLVKRLLANRIPPAPAYTTGNLSGDSGLILLDPNGHNYFGQSGGCACNHYDATGWFYPCVVPADLEQLFSFGDNPSPDEVNEIFAVEGLDITLSAPYEEAWVYVTIGDHQAVLIWNNSD